MEGIIDIKTEPNDVENVYIYETESNGILVNMPENIHSDNLQTSLKEENISIKNVPYDKRLHINDLLQKNKSLKILNNNLNEDIKVEAFPFLLPSGTSASGDQQEEDSDLDDPPSQLSQATGKGSCKSKKPRKNFQLTSEQEDSLLEWLRENELLWRRGHMQFKHVQKKRSLWEQKAQEFGLTADHLQGSWRTMQTWYVKLHKVKSGQVTKKLTDREMDILQKCSFYEGQLRHRSTAPLKPLAQDVEADTLGQQSDAGDGAAGAGLPLDDPNLDDDSAMDGPEVQPPPARAPGDQQEEDSDLDDSPSQLSQATGKGSCKSKKPRNNFQLTPEQEDSLLEWLRENELLWRRGHMQFKNVQKKRSLWEQKAQEFGLTADHLQGFWRTMQTWYVKLHKVKSGQATKKLTDREMDILQKCSFYKGQLRHRSTAPLKPLAQDIEADSLGQQLDAGDGSAGDGPAGDGAGLPLDDPNLDDNSGQDQLLSQLERDAVQLSRAPKRLAEGTRRRTAMQEEDMLKDIQDNMKVNTDLLSQLVHKVDQGPRENLIRYVSEEMRTLPDAQYNIISKMVMQQLTSFLHNPPNFVATPVQWQYPQPPQYPFSQPQNYSQQQYSHPTPTFQQATSTSLPTTQESTQPQYMKSTSTPSTSSAHDEMNSH